jgi:hypothetical protein
VKLIFRDFDGKKKKLTVIDVAYAKSDTEFKLISNKQDEL